MVWHTQIYRDKRSIASRKDGGLLKRSLNCSEPRAAGRGEEGGSRKTTKMKITKMSVKNNKG